MLHDYHLITQPMGRLKSLDWVAEASFKFMSQINLKFKLILLYISSNSHLNLIKLCATQSRKIYLICSSIYELANTI